ncbi:MAG: leucyl aminopeptidase [Planctomycetes bacterium]|nr:leucyl aminopeptidase [Planctomycetota bacterium]
MRTVLTDKVASGRNELVAIVVPDKARVALPDNAPAASLWKADFGDKPGEIVLLRGAQGHRWLLIRSTKKAAMTAEDVRIAAAIARNKAESMDRTSVTVDLSLTKQSIAQLEAAAEGANMAGYDHAIMKADRKKTVVKKISIAVSAANAEGRKAVKQGSITAAANLCARELQNLPANILTPKHFAAEARKVARGSAKISVKILGRKAMEALGAGSLLGVAQGSVNEPQLVHLTYKPGGKSKGRIALVGKGLTFDTGGISLKPSPGMEDMKFDMSGAAAVLGAFEGLAQGAQCDYEVHGILGCVENMPGGNAQRPGDIVTAMNGKTIEVLNTDAEGRLVLADCLCYTDKKVKPDRIYDVATLTGAAIHALGHLTSAVMGNDDKLVNGLIAAGERAGEAYWQLPITEDYRKLTLGQYADLANINKPGQGAGTIAGGCFLSYFVGDRPWVHMDIAATAWNHPAKPYYSEGGGSGVATRTFLELLRSA